MTGRQWWALVVAGVAVAAAIYYFLGDACKSSGRIEALYVSPVLLGIACFSLVAHPEHRWRGIAAGVATAIVTLVLLGFLAFIHYAVGGCYT